MGIPVLYYTLLFALFAWMFLWFIDLVTIIRRPMVYYMLHGIEIK